MLEKYKFPGNARELRNIMERAAILARGGAVAEEHLFLPKALAIPGEAEEFENEDDERETIIAALEETKWNRKRAQRANRPDLRSLGKLVAEESRMRGLAVLTSVVVALLVGCSDQADVLQRPPSPRTTAQDATVIQSFVLGSDRIELSFRPPPPELEFACDVVLIKEGEVQKFVEDIAMKPKAQCACKHERMIRFWKGDDTITVSICDHCFDVIDPGPVATSRKPARFDMPRVLWKRICILDPYHHKGK